MIFNTQLLPLFLGAVAALPSYADVARRRTFGIEPEYYKAPGASDSRGPCPALNTLANHGVLPRNGRNLERDNLITAVRDGFGIAESAIATALVNVFIVCEYVNGHSCGDTLNNLTLLAEPHAFEHDHSFSRQDYKPNYIASFADHADNANLNTTIFEGSSLAAIPGATHVDFTQANELRLQRTKDSLETAWPGWFTQNIPVQEFEFAYIFAVVADPELPGYLTGDPEIRVDFWKYWFVNESFPTPLGWKVPSPPREASYILSASSRILDARVAATPSPLPSDYVSAGPPATLPAAAATVYPLPHYAPYIGPIGQPAGHHHGNRAAKPAPAAAAATPAPTFPPAVAFKNPYAEPLALEDIAAQQAHAANRVAHFEALKAAN
jgi:hypothetical protein